jgi:RNA polymerase sigma factor (sigma-70 family)
MSTESPLPRISLVHTLVGRLLPPRRYRRVCLEDVEQEVWLRLLKCRQRLAHVENLEAYLVMVIRRVAYDMLRYSHILGDQPPLSGEWVESIRDDRCPHPLSSMIRREEQQVVLKLGRDQGARAGRVVAAYLQGLTISEIADELQEPNQLVTQALAAVARRARQYDAEAA